MKHLLLILTLGVTMLFTVTHAMGQTNIALGKVATQSPDAHNGVASRAVDGNTDGNFANGSVTHTISKSYPFWQVNLGARYQITEIRIWNRTDCCAERLNKVAVNIIDSNSLYPFAQTFPSAAATNPLIIPVNVIGDLVQLAINKDEAEYLSLAEVEVFGFPLGQPAPIPTPRGYSIHTDASSVGEWEKFYITAMSDGASSDDASGWYTARIRTKKGPSLSAVNGGGLGCNSDVSPIRTDFVWTEDTSGKEEATTIFRIQDLFDGYVSIQTDDGSYLTAYNRGGQGASSLCNPIYTERRNRIGIADNLLPAHKFKIVNVDGYTKAIQTFDGHYLSAVDGGGRK
jgi:F5/8 type C domain